MVFTYHYMVFALIFTSVLLLHLGNILQIILDIKYHFYPKNDAISCLRRTYPLLKKYLRGSQLGFYEKYVLERELKAFSPGNKYHHYLNYLLSIC